MERTIEGLITLMASGRELIEPVEWVLRGVEPCPDCGSQLEREGRCVFCRCCGWSACR